MDHKHNVTMSNMNEVQDMVTLLSLIGIAWIVCMVWLDIRTVKAVGIEQLE